MLWGVQGGLTKNWPKKSKFWACWSISPSCATAILQLILLSCCNFTTAAQLYDWSAATNYSIAATISIQLPLLCCNYYSTAAAISIQLMLYSFSTAADYCSSANSFYCCCYFFSTYYFSTAAISFQLLKLLLFYCCNLSATFCSITATAFIQLIFLCCLNSTAVALLFLLFYFCCYNSTASAIVLLLLLL